MASHYYGLREANSRNSIDLSQVLNQLNPSILEDTISLDSLSSTSTDFAPPFPSRHMVPMSPTLLEKHSPMFSSAFEEAYERKPLTITLTSPTSPRITKMLTEPLCVGKWVEKLVDSNPPGHIPWGDVEYGKSASWIPEGSIYPPDAFSKALSTARSPRRMKDAHSPPVMFVSSPSSTRGRSASEHHSSFRKALVFERKITLSTGGKTKRWSLQVPANTMNPEMVDMMLELQGLNSFFKDGLDDLDQSVAVLDQQKQRLEPPSLIISDSHCALPLSLGSSGNLAQDPPISLATRRGKVSLPPIAIKKDTLDTAYPSIPTAFLGSPSAYSPKFEFANASDEPSLDLENMVANLRSQCVSIQAQSQPQIQETPHMEPSTPVLGEDDIDDWAFADSLLGAFGSPTPPKFDEQNSPGDHQMTSGDLPTWHNADTFVSPSILSISPGSYSSVKSVVTSITPSNRMLSTAAPSTLLPAAPLPSTSSPSSSPLTTPSSSPREVRGILKSSKNVRFASLPGRKESIDIGPSILVPRHSTDSAIVTPLQRPSRLRTAPVLPKFGEIKENIPTFVPSRAAPSPMPRILDSPGVSLPVSVPPPSPLDSFQTKKATTVDQAPRLLGRQRATSMQKPTPVSLGRNPFKSQENESKARRMSFTPRPTTSSRWTMNEMPFRRGSNAGQQGPDAPKSRMPVPLRNILTRFK